MTKNYIIQDARTGKKFIKAMTPAQANFFDMANDYQTIIGVQA